MNLANNQGVPQAPAPASPNTDTSPIENTLAFVQRVLDEAISSDVDAEVPTRFQNEPTTRRVHKTKSLAAKAAEALARVDRPHEAITLVVHENHFERVGNHLSESGQRNVDQMVKMMETFRQSVIFEVADTKQLECLEPCLYRMFDVHRLSADRVRVRRTDLELSAGRIRMQFQKM